MLHLKILNLIVCIWILFNHKYASRLLLMLVLLLNGLPVTVKVNGAAKVLLMLRLVVLGLWARVDQGVR